MNIHKDFDDITETINDCNDDYDLRLSHTLMQHFLKDHKDKNECADLYMQLNASFLKKKTEISIFNKQKSLAL